MKRDLEQVPFKSRVRALSAAASAGVTVWSPGCGTWIPESSEEIQFSSLWSNAQAGAPGGAGADGGARPRARLSPGFLVKATTIEEMR